MGIIEGIKRYFHGSSKDEKVRRFEELQNTIETSRRELDVAVKGLNTFISGVDEVKKAAATVIGTAGVTPDNISVALDNMKFSDSKFVSYMDGFAHTTKSHKSELEKAERDMIKLIEDNPDMAIIIVDVKHDEDLEKSLDIVLSTYKDGVIDKKAAIIAYNNAVASRRTDRDLSPVLDKHLKDN